MAAHGVPASTDRASERPQTPARSRSLLRLLGPTASWAATPVHPTGGAVTGPVPPGRRLCWGFSWAPSPRPEQQSPETWPPAPCAHGGRGIPPRPHVTRPPAARPALPAGSERRPHDVPAAAPPAPPLSAGKAARTPPPAPAQPARTPRPAFSLPATPAWSLTPLLLVPPAASPSSPARR